MYAMNGVIKAPQARVGELLAALFALGVSQVTQRMVPYQEFMAESRLNWDFVFPEMETEGKPVVYLEFSFPDTDAGRQACYEVEFQLPQIPLNLHYVPLEGGSGK